MANNNKTVEQACEKMRLFRDCDGDYVRELEDFADDIEDAHKREIAAKDDERLTVVANYESVIAAKDRIIAAKDAEILSLKQKIDEYEREPELMADTATKALELLKRQDAEIASLRSLVKELADDLSGYLCESECNGACVSFGHCCSQTSRQIVAKALEVVEV